MRRGSMPTIPPCSMHIWKYKRRRKRPKARKRRKSRASSTRRRSEQREGRQAMFLGIEIGGTKLQLGLGRGDGTILHRWRGNVEVAAGGDGIRRRIVAALPELLAQAGMAQSQLRLSHSRLSEQL